MFKKIKARLFGKITGYEPRIVIQIGCNAYSSTEAKNKAQEIANIIQIKLQDYLQNYPYQIYVD